MAPPAAAGTGAAEPGLGHFSLRSPGSARGAGWECGAPGGDWGRAAGLPRGGAALRSRSPTLAGAAAGRGRPAARPRLRGEETNRRHRSAAPGAAPGAGGRGVLVAYLPSSLLCVSSSGCGAGFLRCLPASIWRPGPGPGPRPRPQAALQSCAKAAAGQAGGEPPPGPSAAAGGKGCGGDPSSRTEGLAGRKGSVLVPAEARTALPGVTAQLSSA